MRRRMEEAYAYKEEAEVQGDGYKEDGGTRRTMEDKEEEEEEED